MSTRLQLGAVLPSDGLGDDPAVLRDFAQAAEDLGYDWIEMFDHVLGSPHAGRVPKLPAFYDETNAFHEPLTTLSYLAAVTTGIGLGTSVLVISQRQTALVAKQATQIQILSGGRFRIGLGTGWNWVEYEALGVPWAGRGKRLEEQVAVLRLLLTDPCVTFHGQFHDIDRAGLKPLADRPPPIWLGGGADVVIDRAARVADGFVVPMWGEIGRAQLRAVQERLDHHGREVDGFPVEMILDGAFGPDALRGEARAFAQAGGTHVALRNDDATAPAMGVPFNGFTRPQQFIDALAVFAEAVR